MEDPTALRALRDPYGRSLPLWCSPDTCSDLTGHSPTTVRRNIASNPELGRKSGRQLLVNLPLYLKMIEELPRAALAISPDRPGPIATARARAAAEVANTQSRNRRSKELEPAAIA